MGRYCDEKGCKTRANFGFPGKGATKCKKDMLEGMIDVLSKKCIHVKDGKRCTKQPIFNYPDKKGGLYCSDDKLPGMIDVKSKKCDYDENGEKCIKRPNFNFEDEIRGRRCEEHKLKGMVDVNHPRCIHVNDETVERCTERAYYYYNDEDEKSLLFCYKHKDSEMINQNSKKCEKCNKRPNYNFKEEKGGRFCGDHKLDEMIDVVSKKCEDCDILASFGPLFGSKRHCEAHKSSNEFRNRNPICEADDCCETAFYTNDGLNYPRRCEKHVLINDVNIVEKPCIKCGLSFFLNEKTGLCDYCNEFFIKKVHKEKETRVITFIKDKKFNLISTDKIVKFGCSKYRPDAVIDFKYFIGVNEVDENQHTGYSYICEMARMIQLHQDYGGIPIVFIRYNPDNYEVKIDGKKKVVKPNDEYRLKELYKILKWLETIRDGYETNKYRLPPLSVIYMFYDGYIKPELKEIDILKETKKISS